MFYPAFLDVLYYVGGILESLTSNITGNGDPTWSSIHYSLVSPIPKFFPPKVQALFVLLHLMIILYCLFWSSSLKHLTNAAHFLLDETIFSLCFHNMNFTQFSAYLSSHCFWSPLLAPAFPRLHFFWIMAILKALLEPSSLFLQLLRNSCSLPRLYVPCRSQCLLSWTPHLFSISQAQTHKASCLLNIFTGMPYSSNLTCPSSFSQKCSSFKCPYLSRWPNHPPVIQSRFSDSFASFCSLSALLAIITKACQIRSEISLQSLLASIPAPFSSPRNAVTASQLALSTCLLLSSIYI